jgi:hypothetical protein
MQKALLPRVNLLTTTTMAPSKKEVQAIFHSSFEKRFPPSVYKQPSEKMYKVGGICH